MATADTCLTRTLAGTIRGTNFSISGIDAATKGLVQNFQLSFQRQLSRIYDLASQYFYYIEGPSQGNIVLNKVVGPLGAPKILCTCTAQDIVLDAGPTICSANNGGPLGSGSVTASYTLKNAMSYGLTGQGDANNFLIIFGVSYLFNDIT